MSFTTGLIALAVILLALLATTRAGTWLIERDNPPVGDFADIGGTKLHFVDLPAPSAELPPILFVHGASGNLRDQMVPSRPLLQGRARLIYVDRPGHGWSERGRGNETLAGQAQTLAGLLDHLGIDRAIVVGHSLGGAVAATFAVEHPDRVAGLVFAAPATHPWPGGGTSWYYHAATLPVLGRAFTELLTLPGGFLSIAAASSAVFSPNPLPEGYRREAGIALVLRPASFRANATDVATLSDQLEAIAPRYREIKAPTVIISGNRDTVVYEELHSGGMKRDIEGSELVWIDNLGHKPDWIAPDLVVAAIERVAGHTVDLRKIALMVEARIADDAHVLSAQREEKPALAEGSR